MSSASLSGLEVLRDFRAKVLRFNAATQATLDGAGNDVSKVLDWLRVEQQAHWKREIRVREDAYQNARRLWLEADTDVRAGPRRGIADRASSMDERVAMDRARRRRDEAEEKLALVRKYLDRIERDCAPLVHLCRGIDQRLRDGGEAAVKRLDQQITSVEQYQGQA